MSTTPSPSILLTDSNNTGTSIIVVVPPTGDAAQDTPNIQWAIDQAAGGGGGTVILQNGGEYCIQSSGSQNGQNYGILMKQGIILKGVSEYGVVLQPVDPDLAVIMWAEGDGSQLFTALSSFSIINANPISNANVTGILLGTLQQPIYDPLSFSIPIATVNNIFIQGVNVGIQACTWKSTISECFIDQCNSGIRLEFKWWDGYTSENYDRTNTTTVSNCLVSDSNEVNIYVRGISNIVTGCNIRIPIDGTGILIDASPTSTYDYARGQSNKVLNNYIEKSDLREGVNIVGVSVVTDGNIISNNYFDIPIFAYDDSCNYVFNSPTSQGKNVLVGNFSSGQDPAGLALYNQLNSELQVNSGVGTNGIVLEANGSGNSPLLVFKDSETGQIHKYAMRYDGYVKRFYLGYGDDDAGSGGFTEQVTIDQPTGNVGIGTTSPGEKLQINEGALRVLNGVGSNGIILEASASGNSPFLVFKDSESGQEHKYAMKYDGSAKRFYIGYGDSSSFNAQVSIDQATSSLIISGGHIPTLSSDSSGYLGQIGWDASYLYVKTSDSGSNKWGRIALSYGW